MAWFDVCGRHLVLMLTSKFWTFGRLSGRQWIVVEPCNNTCTVLHALLNWLFKAATPRVLALLTVL